MFDPQTITIALIAAVPGFILGAASLYLALRKAPVEIAKTSADGEASRAEAAESYANATATYAKEVASLRTEVSDLRKKLDESDKLKQSLAWQVEDLMDWADRLVHQVKSLGDQPPVPFRQRRKTD